jgi:hypothetical protein
VPLSRDGTDTHGNLTLACAACNQRIAGATFQTPADVVRWMSAMQAQDYHQALWAIGLRMPSATVAQVEQAIADG